MEYPRLPRSKKSGRLAGLQVHLDRLAKECWRDDRLERPKAMAVRSEDEVVAYVNQILNLRERAVNLGFKQYLMAEDELLKLAEGKLPAAIQLRAQIHYRNSPRCRVAEARYGGKYGKWPSQVMEEFQEQTGWPPEAFEARLTDAEKEIWKTFKYQEDVARIRQMHKPNGDLSQLPEKSDDPSILELDHPSNRPGRPS